MKERKFPTFVGKKQKKTLKIIQGYKLKFESINYMYNNISFL